MNANQLNLSLKFRGGLPTLILRDHVEGRVKVFCGGEWIATVIPGHLLRVEQEAVLLSIDCTYEERGSFGSVAAALSTLQQSGLNWEAACEDFQSYSDLERELGF